MEREESMSRKAESIWAKSALYSRKEILLMKIFTFPYDYMFTYLNVSFLQWKRKIGG